MNMLFIVFLSVSVRLWHCLFSAETRLCKLNFFDEYQLMFFRNTTNKMSLEFMYVQIHTYDSRNASLILVLIYFFLNLPGLDYLLRAKFCCYNNVYLN